MKVYFTGAEIEIPQKHFENYRQIIETLKDLGHRVIADHLLGKLADVYLAEEIPEKKRDALHKKMLAWKNQADAMVCEASYPSISLGQEIAYALSRNTPVIVLYQPDRKPRLLRALSSDRLHVVEYTAETLAEVLEDYLEYSKEVADTRFNFFISPRIGNYLDFVAKKRRVPRAVYLRRLIEEHMQENEEYQDVTGIELVE